jgi:BioD-like phosphotransacetylase family protein
LNLAAKRLYVTATRREDGKTAVVLGLMRALMKRTPQIGFMKPLGKRDVEQRGIGLDEDSILIEKVCQVHCSLQDMSPVTVDREFSQEFFTAGTGEDLRARILEAFRRIAEGKDAVLIEGTGHACLGSVYGLSNATVAKALGAKVLVISSGGVATAIDELALNISFFRQHGVEVVGALVNKAGPDDIPLLQDFGRRALERMGVKLLGVLPRRPLLESKSLLQVFEGLAAQPLNSSPRLGMRVQKTLVGALTTHHAMDHFEDDALLITGGDRTDLLVAATVSKNMTREGRGIAGVIVTRGLRPPDSIMALLTKAEIPVALVRSDTYNTARRVHELEPKMAPNDKAKHDLALELIEQNMDVGRLYDEL